MFDVPLMLLVMFRPFESVGSHSNGAAHVTSHMQPRRESRRV